jgi:putative phosphonate metabolism protein
MSERYAIYYAPAEGSPLDVFGRRWFGRNSAGRLISDGIKIAGIDHETQEALIVGPRRYGFHGTLKAPFRLAAGASADRLRTAVAEFANGCDVFAFDVELATLETFVALRPASPCLGLTRLADECAVRFDRYRAPLTEKELAKRRAARLSARQERYLQRWGYPYVFEEFRFHLTLTDPIADDVDRTRVLDALWPVLSPLCAEPVIVRELCLFRQEAPEAMFVLDDRFPFSG